MIYTDSVPIKGYYRASDGRCYRRYKTKKTLEKEHQKLLDQYDSFLETTHDERRRLRSRHGGKLYNEFNNMVAYVINYNNNYLNTVKFTRGQLYRYRSRIIQEKGNSGKKYLVIDFTHVYGGKYIILDKKTRRPMEIKS